MHLTYNCLYMYSVTCAYVHLNLHLHVYLGIIRNREVGRLREVTDTWEPMGKSIGTVQNWPY